MRQLTDSGGIRADREAIRAVASPGVEDTPARKMMTAVAPVAKTVGFFERRFLRDAQILVATPGRLHDLIDRGVLTVQGVPALVLDEADRMLDMGFKPQVDRILRDVPENRQTLLFSATLGGPVMDLARTYTSNPVHVRLERPAEQRRADIDHRFMAVTPDTKIRLLAETIGHADGLSLVFVRTKHGAHRLARKLARDHDLRAAVMHGDMSQNGRERSLAQFEAGKVTALVATDVAARGLDVEAITHVINFDPPRTDDDYVHRVGRTGRAGRSGTGVTLVLPEQRTDVGGRAGRLGHADAFAASVGRASAAPQRRRRRRAEPAVEAPRAARRTSRGYALRSRAFRRPATTGGREQTDLRTAQRVTGDEWKGEKPVDPQSSNLSSQLRCSRCRRAPRDGADYVTWRALDEGAVAWVPDNARDRRKRDERINREALMIHKPQRTPEVVVP